jgi:hypothetical protein
MHAVQMLDNSRNFWIWCNYSRAVPKRQQEEGHDHLQWNGLIQTDLLRRMNSCASRNSWPANYPLSMNNCEEGESASVSIQPEQRFSDHLFYSSAAQHQHHLIEECINSERLYDEV